MIAAEMNKTSWKIRRNTASKPDLVKGDLDSDARLLGNRTD